MLFCFRVSDTLSLLKEQNIRATAKSLPHALYPYAVLACCPKVGSVLCKSGSGLPSSLCLALKSLTLSDGTALSLFYIEFPLVLLIHSSDSGSPSLNYATTLASLTLCSCASLDTADGAFLCAGTVTSPHWHCASTQLLFLSHFPSEVEERGEKWGDS